MSTHNIYIFGEMTNSIIIAIAIIIIIIIINIIFG